MVLALGKATVDLAKDHISGIQVWKLPDNGLSTMS